MSTTLRPYIDYRTVDLPGVGAIPVSWDLKPLKQITNVQLSNVDKLSEETEQPVLLCNYVDVYKQFEDDPSFKQWLGNLIFNATYQPPASRQG